METKQSSMYLVTIRNYPKKILKKLKEPYMIWSEAQKPLHPELKHFKIEKPNPGVGASPRKVQKYKNAF